MNVNAKNHQDSGAGSAGVLTEFAFSESKKAISVIQLDQPWFAAVDVCNILGLTNPADIVKKTLDEDEYLTYTVYRSGQLRELLFVNEPGLYALIFKSRKNEAK
jgi:anti-repressor protein